MRKSRDLLQAGLPKLSYARGSQCIDGNVIGLAYTHASFQGLIRCPSSAVIDRDRPSLGQRRWAVEEPAAWICTLTFWVSR
jgi:hypothetical protein